MSEKIKDLLKWFITGAIEFVVVITIIFLVFLPNMEIVMPLHIWLVGAIVILLMEPLLLLAFGYTLILMGWISWERTYD